jgi:beta-glucosidase
LSNLSLLQEFPSDFIFGVATSSYQIEGNAYGGCGKSIWDDFAQRKLYGIDGQKACNHYSFFKEDIKLIKEAGFKAYRFSFAWPRLFPENDNQINQEGVDFYHRLLEEIHANDLEPFPTLFHWDLPIRFLKNGGWESKDTSKRFADYANFISKNFGDQFKSIATINEPWCISWLSHYLGEHAPGKKDLKAAVHSMHNILLAHSLSIDSLKSEHNHQIGIVLNNEYGEPIDQNEKNIQAAKLFDAIYNCWFADAIFKGKYPQIALDLFEPLMPQDYQSDLKIISKPIDWLGINYYTRSLIKSKVSEDGVDYECHRGSLKSTDMGWEFYPQGLSYFINRIHQEYDEKIPIYITENGMANNDNINSKGNIEDLDRIEYFQLHLQETLECIKKGIPIKGYFAWSLLDNYEWSFGYDKRFGLIYVDYENFSRKTKRSYKEFQKYL